MASGYYDITNKTLGKGHYGVVKLGRHCLTGEPVAIKIIEKSRLNHDSLTQLGTEIRILFRLSEYEHPNILKLYQTIDTEDKLFLVTEYCGPHACDLHDYLSRKHCRDGLSHKEAKIFFIQICSAISYCHSMGIVHRDLKPENILVTDYKHMYTNSDNNPTKVPSSSTNEAQYPLLKLIDFGFANQWYPDEKMRTSCGTLAYSAPELLLGEPYDGTKVDVWGLGLMLYILLYGGNPFMQINDNETLTKILDCSFVTPTRDNVDCNAIDLLRSLIKRNPDTRLPLDAIMRHKWFSSVSKTLDMLLNYPIKHDQNQASTKQLPKLVQQLSNSPLPSISEIGPLRNLNKSADDNQVTRATLEEISETPKPNYNRTRSLSITRTHSKTAQQQSLPQTRSSINLERLSHHPSTPFAPRTTPIYRPTSPDVSGPILPTEEENQLHERVIHEMFRLTKFIDSKSSIEASLKNARTTHRLFNQNSIQPAQFGKRKISTGIMRSLIHTNKSSSKPEQQSKEGNNNNNTNNNNNNSSGSGNNDKTSSTTDKLSVINSKLSNDDYIYATYQLTRDRILRLKQERLKKQIGIEQNDYVTSNQILAEGSAESNVIHEEEVLGGGAFESLSQVDIDRSSAAKENEEGLRSQQRKLLQPQHKMRDKFTSFFRSGSTSPSGSFSASCESQNSNETNATKDHVNMPDTHHHEAFNDHNNEMSSSMSRYFGMKTESHESTTAYALPLARKCSLVSEESGCSNEPTDI